MTGPPRDRDPASPRGRHLTLSFRFSFSKPAVGATLCLPRTPLCPICPLRRFCATADPAAAAEIPQLTRAKAKCEEFVESQLFIGKNPSGAQFALTNNYEGWANRQDINHGGQKDNPLFATPNDDEIIARYQQKQKDKP